MQYSTICRYCDPWSFRIWSTRGQREARGAIARFRASGRYGIDILLNPLQNSYRFINTNKTNKAFFMSRILASVKLRLTSNLLLPRHYLKLPMKSFSGIKHHWNRVAIMDTAHWVQWVSSREWKIPLNSTVFSRWFLSASDPTQTFSRNTGQWSRGSLAICTKLSLSSYSAS